MRASCAIQPSAPLALWTRKFDPLLPPRLAPAQTRQMLSAEGVANGLESFRGLSRPC